MAGLGINVRDVEDIVYDEETDLITIKWAEYYTENTKYHDKDSKSVMSKKYGCNAKGLKDFVYDLIKYIEESKDDQIKKYGEILKKLE